ncbi:MAG TPA: ADP-ribosylglycohydrolase family protein, partial [Thermomicrobiales bacterium]|nr:ADP-ribosylglycohydrolase family protein [Thermomicrobiales bacterium]
QERTLGSILGLGIGDALGMPVSGWSPERIAETYGTIDGYHPLVFADGTELKAGEFTDETEIALCIMETYTSANGELDPELIRARMQFLARDESRRWMSAETLRSLDDENEPWYRSPDDTDPEVAMRGVPIGIIHAAPTIDEAALYRDIETVVGLTHSSRVAVDQAALVAIAVARVLSGADDQTTLLPSLIAMAPSDTLRAALESGRADQESETSNPAVDVIRTGIGAFARAQRFEDAVFTAASAGGATDARAALAGALAGAHFGAGGIPQTLIDELEGRIYLTLAAPWFYRTIQLMTGRGLTLGANGS